MFTIVAAMSSMLNVVLFVICSTILRTLRNAVVVLPGQRIISRGAGGTVITDEVTLVGENDIEYAALPAGTAADLEAITNALAAGDVLLVFGVEGPQYVRLPPGAQVYTAAQMVERLRHRDERSEP